MEQYCSNNSKFSKLRVVLIPLEFTAWERARSWTYASQLGFEEGFVANNVEFFTIPVLQEIPSSSPACWLYYAQQLCKNKRFDQVWVSLVHPQYDDVFLSWLKEIAPVRVGFLMESLEFTMQELQIHPHLKKRRERAENQIRYMTHILACDEADAEQINKQGRCRALWYPSAVPERFLAGSPVINRDKAIFGGSVYAERHKWLKQYDLESLLVWHASDDNSTDYPKLFDEANRHSITFLQQNRNPSEEFLLEYLKALRNIRRHCFQLWLNSLKTGCAVVNLPHVFKAYAGRVVEAMAAGRPVISWEIPDRPRNKTLFENGSEILLFDKSRPQQLADHIRHVQSNPDFAYQLADNALIKMRKFHTIENRVRQVLDWIETGMEPVFGEVGKSIELKQDKQGTLLAPVGTCGVEGQKHHQNRPADRRLTRQRDSAAKSYFIKRGYQCNLDTKGNAIPYFDDVDSSSSFQADVYRFAADVVRKYRLKNVLDIGCGFGIKLSQHIYPVCHDITGIDVEHAIEFCKRKHSFGRWFVDDIQKPDLRLDRQFDLIIAADVIEHLANPDALLEYINSYCHSNTFIVLSTPERDITRGRDSSGPSVNETHVREWSMSEFHKYICSYGYRIIQSCLVKDRDVSLLKNCQVLLCRPGVGLQQGRGGKTNLKRQTVPVGELPAVSVVIPCYNQAEFLPEAVESIVDQTFQDWECIIVNDGSTDETSKVADCLIAKYADKRIRLLEKENGGLADARNAGIMAATADWILLLDSDDIYRPRFLEKAFDIIHTDPSANVVFANPQKFGAKSGEWIPEDYTPQKILRYNTIVGTSLFKRQLWEKVGGYNPSIPWGAEDWDFWISCSKLGLVVKRVEGRHFFYRIHEKGSMYTDVVEHSDEVRAAIRTAHPDLYVFQQLLSDHKLISDMHPDTFEVINKKIDKFPYLPLPYFWRALKYERDGRFDEAVGDYNKAIQYGNAEDWQSFLHLGLLQGRKGNIQRAQHNIKKVLSIRPDFKWVQDMLLRLKYNANTKGVVKDDSQGRKGDLSLTKYGKEKPEICSNLEHWKRLQENQYFEKHQYYAGLKAYGKDYEIINKYISLSRRMKVVIVGCGYGREALLIAPHVKHIYGIDVSRTILDKTDRFLAQQGITNFTSVLAEDWKDVIPDDIDLVYSIAVFQHLTRDLVADYIRGLAKKLSPNGKFVCQFADLDCGTYDVDPGAYEPSVRWSKSEIGQLIKESGLTKYAIDTEVKDKGNWHWAFFGKQAANFACTKTKILFYYDGLSDLGRNLGGTVMAVLSFAKMLLHGRPGVVIHLTGAHVQHRRQYKSFQVIPPPQEDKRDEFIADYDVVFFVTHFRYFKGIAKPPGQIWILYQHCWDMDGGVLSRLNDFDIVLCLSKAHANELSRYGVPVHKQIIVPNLVDTDFYRPQNVERKGHSIMYAGAVHEHKGIHILLDAFRSVRQIVRDIELHIYGSRSMWTGTDDYENRIKAAKTGGVYFHGYIDIKDMPKVYSKHSILCLPSKLESFGLVTVEAQACGCVPVVHNAGGAAATLLDGQTGFLYSPNTKEQLGRAILKAISAVDANSSIRQRAIDFIRDNFSTAKVKCCISKLWDRFAVAGEVNAVRALFESNNIDSAGVECERLLQKYPEHPDLLLLEALIQLHRGDTGKCKSMLLDLNKKFDRHQMAINNLGVLLMSEGQQAQALKFFIKALNINPYDRNTAINCTLALKTSGRYKEAKTALLNYLSKVGEDAQVLSLVREIDNLIKGADLKPHIGTQQLLKPREDEHIKRNRTGVIIFGHTRPLLLRNVLESLRRQGTNNDIHVWLDGHHGRASLIKPVQQCIELVKTQFPQAHLRTMNGNVGIEKLMMDGLSFMASRYERIIVLEDDCFPASCAIEEFEKALDEIEQRQEVYSVYGHHFLIESESETITRFQGWGWATTHQKLLPVLTEMKKCFAMSESEYLQWARKNLTPEVIKRLDVTPGRNCVHVIASQFCWDGCTCLVTAMRQLVHKKTAKRVIYNCGMGDGSTHFPLNDKFRRPPFNMITPQEVWDYYDVPSGRSTSALDESKPASLTPAFLDRRTSSPQTRDIVVDGLTFANVRRTKHKNNSVGFNDGYIIKIEHQKHPLKLRSLSEEIEIIKYLNSRGCVSCPRLVSDGKLKTGERYFIQQRIDSCRKFNTADMLFSILEQKSLGVCQGDLKIENFIFDGDSVCYIIDYDQAIYDERFVRMGNIEYFQWIAQYIVNRWKNHGITDFYTSHGLNKDEIFSLFRNGAFNLAATTIFKEQITTDSDSGVYHSLNTDKLYIEGARDLNPRLDVLNIIEFKDGETVLDVGCNMGLLAHYLHDRGCTVTGIDMDRKIIIGAKMVANILNRDIQFKCLDVDEAAIEREYDTICLFSVIHHVKNFRQVTANIAQKCNRIILECGLRERGSKPVGGRWTATSGWQFNSLQEVVHYLEAAFRGFKLQSSHGSVDRDRHIVSFVKKPAAVPIQIQSESPINIRRENLVAQQSSDEPEYLVSAIVSTYNSERFLTVCLQDLENQTIADKLEIIVVNSGSQENEEAIVRRFQQRYNNIVYIKTEQREGVYAAWNRAVGAARGRFLTNANTDDRHRQDALEVMADTLLANPDIALVYGDQICTDTPNGTFASHHANLMTKRPDYSRERLLFGCCVGSQPMWRKSLHNEFGYFDETLTCAADWDFWLRISSKYKFKHIPDFLGLYYHNKDGVEHGRKIHSLYERYVVGKRYGTPYISVIPLYNTKDNPLVSVIMPTYNAAEYISEAIESVLIQNYRNFELIVVDDGSTDNTKDIITGFSDERIKYFYQENSGPAATNNEGIKKSRGAFLIRLDSDDMMTPDFIARHLQQFEKHPEADLVYCDDCLIDESDKLIRVIERREYSDRKSLIRDLFRGGFPVVPFRTCIRRSVFDKIGLFDESLTVAEDYDMMRRFVKHGLKAHHLRGVLYLRRMATNSLTRNYSAQNAKCHFDVVERFINTFSCDELFPDVDWDKIPADLRQMHAKCLAAVTFLAIGQTYVKSKLPLYADMAFGQACSQLTDCLKIDPANQRVRQILQKCRLARAKYSGSVKQAAGHS